MKLSALVIALLLAGCGLSTDTEKTVATKPPTAESHASVKQIEVCITSSDGKHIVTSDGICLNPGYKVDVIDEEPPKAKFLPPPPPAPAPAPARAYAPRPLETFTATESLIVTSNGITPKIREPKPYVPRVKPAPKETPRKAKTSADDVLSQLFLASVAFVVPDRANISDRIKAELLIDFTESAKELEKKLSLEGKTISGEILVSRIVTAKIFAPEFDVVNITPEKQPLATSQNTKWQWELTPLKAGQHEVTISVSAHVKVDDTSAERYIGTYNKKVSIKVTPFQVLGSWMDRHWQWLASTLLIPLGIWHWQRRKKRKATEDELNASLS